MRGHGAYVNFAGEDGSVRDAYPGHYERLAAIKAVWDPTNLFRLNHNIEPRPSTKKEQTADRAMSPRSTGETSVA